MTVQSQDPRITDYDPGRVARPPANTTRSMPSQHDKRRADRAVDTREAPDLRTRGRGPTAADVMTTPPPTIDHDATLLELAYRLVARECPEVVVTSGDRPLGVVTLRDLARAWPNEASILARRPASSLLPTRTRRVLPDLDIATVAAVMADEHLDAVPVVDRFGALIGVISARQIVELVAQDDPLHHRDRPSVTTASGRPSCCTSPWVTGSFVTPQGAR